MDPAAETTRVETTPSGSAASSPTAVGESPPPPPLLPSSPPPPSHSSHSSHSSNAAHVVDRGAAAAGGRAPRPLPPPPSRRAKVRSIISSASSSSPSSSTVTFGGISSSSSVDVRRRGGGGCDDDDYPMGCSFSPDGSCVLTAMSAGGEFRLYDTPWAHIMIAKDRDDVGDGVDRNDEEGEECDDDKRNKNEQGGGGGEHDVGGGGGANFFCSHNQNYHAPAARDRPLFRPWKASLTSHQGGPPPPSSSSSYAWYPHMSSADPSSAVYATCRGPSTPIHLIDAYTSALRASYRPYNSVDAMEGPTVVAFSSCGSRVYGTGFKSDRTIAVFDTSVPGRDGCIARLGKTRRSGDGQKGVPSALAFPGGGGRGPSGVFAVGTYSPASIYVYDDRTAGCVPSGTFVLNGGTAVVGHGRAFSRKRRRSPAAAGGRPGDGGGDDDDVRTNGNGDDDLPLSSARVDWFQSRARGGVTQLTWAPSSSSNPHVLFSASRHSDAVLSWDVRTLSGLDASTDGSNGYPSGRRGGGGRKRACGGLRSYSRGDGDNSTNQRLEFELDDEGRRMFVGSNDEGMVRIYDVSSGRLEGALDVFDNAVGGVGGGRGGGTRKKMDAVNGLSYFRCGAGGRYDGLLAAAVGSRRFGDLQSDDDDDDDDDNGRVGGGRRAVEELPPGCLQLHGMNISGV